MSVPEEVLAAVRRAAESRPTGLVRELTLPFLHAVAGAVENVGVRIPSPSSMRCAMQGGPVVDERVGAA